MKINYLIPIIAVAGLITLFFFPEPETNFFAYVGTALFFIIIISFLILRNRRRK